MLRKTSLITFKVRLILMKFHLSPIIKTQLMMMKKLKIKLGDPSWTGNRRDF
jgi:hypothetical protein